MGGKSPHIVFADANLDLAVPGSIKAFLLNAGQACSAGSRRLVERPIHHEFVRRLKIRLDQVKIASGKGSTVGPISTRAQFDKVQSYCALAKAKSVHAYEAGVLETVAGKEEGRYVRLLVLRDSEAVAVQPATTRLIARWSCSTMLLRYLIWRISMWSASIGSATVIQDFVFGFALNHACPERQTSWGWCLDSEFLSKYRFHFKSKADGLVAAIKLHITPFHDRSFTDIFREAQVMGNPNRQGAQLERRLCRD